MESGRTVIPQMYMSTYLKAIKVQRLEIQS